MPISFDGKKGEFSECVKHFMNKVNDRTGKKFSSEEARKTCGSIQSKQEKAHWFSTFITEDFKEADQIIEDRVRIKGIAIKARESRNGVLYEIDELTKSADTLLNKTIAMNHSENAEDVIGIVDNISINGDNINYEGVAYNTGKHPYVVEMLRKGLIRHVSIEALTPHVEKKENKRVAKNLEFVGLAFVRHPGIPEASASVVEAFKMDNEVDELIDEIVEDKHGEEHKCPEGQTWNDKEGKCMSMKGKDHTENTVDIKSDTAQIQQEIKIGDKMEEKNIENQEIAKLREELASIREEFKKSQETSKGTITEEVKSPYTIVETLDRKETYPKGTIVTERDQNGVISTIFPVHPSEWY